MSEEDTVEVRRLARMHQDRTIELAHQLRGERMWRKALLGPGADETTDEREVEFDLSDTGLLGFTMRADGVVLLVNVGSPADAAGLEIGDNITAVDGQRVEHLAPEILESLAEGFLFGPRRLRVRMWTYAAATSERDSGNDSAENTPAFWLARNATAERSVFSFALQSERENLRPEDITE